MRKDWERVNARDILGDGPTLERDLTMLSISFMPETERNDYLKQHPDLLKHWNKMFNIQEG